MPLTVHFDIETIPSQEQWVQDYYLAKAQEVIAEKTPPKNIKKQETIDAWIEENKGSEAIEEEFQGNIKSASFSGASNHICCISWAIDNGKEKGEIKSAFIRDDVSKEADQLQNFFDSISKLYTGTVFAGHNMIGFDLRVIKQRAMVLGVKIPPVFPTDPKPWDKNVYDTMLKWDSKTFVKMDLIAKALGIEGKGQVDGSMVYPMWREGKFEEIAKYCEDDVRMGRAIYDRMTFNF